MGQKQGASLRDRAGGPSDPSRCASQPKALIPCAVCGRPLENCYEGGNQPLDGIEFNSAGHYGTTVFDPMDGTRLLVNFCDLCLKGLAYQGRVAVTPFMGDPTLWVPDE